MVLGSLCGPGSLNVSRGQIYGYSNSLCDFKVILDLLIILVKGNTFIFYANKVKYMDECNESDVCLFFSPELNEKCF